MESNEWYPECYPQDILDTLERIRLKQPSVDNSDDTSEAIGSPIDYFNVQLED